MDPLQQVLEQLRELRSEVREMRSELSSGVSDLKVLTASHNTWIAGHEAADKATHEALHREISELRAGLAEVRQRIAYYVGGAGVAGAVVSFLAPRLAAAL
jgi:chromosome segregation ATPase